MYCKCESYNIIRYTNLFTELTAVKNDEIDINILQKQDGELKADIHFDVSNALVSRARLLPFLRSDDGEGVWSIELTFLSQLRNLAAVLV